MQRLARRRGQMLLEAIVALGILTTGFLGILALLSRSFAEARMVSDETTATYLAAEGIELAKNILDHGMYRGQWPCFPGSGDYEFDYTVLTSGSDDCSSLSPSGNYAYNSATFLTFDSATSLYGYESGAGTITTNFTRDIKVSLSPDGTEATVDSIVQQWSGGTAVNTIDLQDEFYNWFPG